MEQAVRVGVVSSVNEKKRTARVIFGDKANMVSGELVVLRNSPLITAVITTNGDEWTMKHTYSGTSSSGNGSVVALNSSSSTIHGELPAKEHCADVSVFDWLPRIGQTVLCIMVRSGDGDGFIIGGV